MATQEPIHTVNEPVPADIPDKRKYDRREDADLDRALVEAINAAETADNDFLRQLLALELGSHYYETR
jgi:hypothetical protein